jgi:hypothetical protein
VHDVTFTGTVTRSLGSEIESGTAILRALGPDESRVDLALPTGTQTEIRDSSSGNRQDKWITPDGSSGMFASHNCWTDAVWFFPCSGL